MTSSGAPQPEDAGQEQGGIWEEAPEAGGRVRTPDDSPSSPGAFASRLTATAQAPAPAGLIYADMPNRIIALIVDVIVLSVSGLVLALLLGGLVTPSGATDAAGGELDIGAFIVVLVLQVALSVAYFGGLWTLTGATLGMRLLGLRVGDEADGRLIAPRQSLVRWLIVGIPALLATVGVYVPNTIGPILSALGIAWLLLLLYSMAQSPAKQGLHDRFAHTIVVKARRRST